MRGFAPAIFAASFALSIVVAVAADANARTALVLAAATPCVVVGAVLVARRPSNAVSWLVAATGLGMGVIVAARAYALAAAPVQRPAVVFAAWLSSWLRIPVDLTVLVGLPLLFPDGRLPSGRWRPVGLGVVVAVTVSALAGIFASELALGTWRIDNPVGVAGLPVVDENPLLIPVWLLGFGIAVVAVTSRFRRATGIERQQIKWFLAAASLVLLLPIAEVLAPPLIGDVVFVAVLVALPTAVGVAVLRYRLYDIDRLINRTVVYAVVTVVLGALYALVAVLPTALLDLGDSDLLVAGATLAAAAAFRPVRRSVQGFVDRRFNRSRYDAARTVEAFAARLRDQVQLDTLADELRTVIGTTVQPRAVSVWVRPVTVPERSHP